MAAVYSKSEGNANALRVRVKGTDFTGNASTGQGGAVYLEGVEAAFTDSNFQNNTSSKEGGAIYAKGGQVTLAAANADVVISGNKDASKNASGFLYAADAANVTLDAAEGRTITIGTAGESTDGLASYTTRDSHGTLTKTGAGKVVINSSMESWNNDITVEAGTLEILSKIGSYDLNVAATKSFDTNYAHKVTVKNGATAILHDVLFNSRVINGARQCEGFAIYAEAGSTVQGGTFTVSASNYGILPEQRGLGSIDVAAGATASAQQLVINDGTFRVWGSGNFTVGSVTIGSTGQLEFRGSSVTRINGTVTAEAGVLTAFDSGATLETAWTNLINDGLETKTVFGEALGTVKGKIVETAWTGTYTLDQLKDANQFFGKVDTGVFSFENATLVGDENGNVSIDKVLTTGGTYGSSTLKAAPSKDGAVAITDVSTAISFGALEVDSATTNVSVTNSAVVTLVGAKDSGNLLEGRNVERLDFSGTLNLGADAEDVGTVNANALSAATLNVNGAYAAKTVQTMNGTVAEGASLSMGTLILKDNSSSGTMKVEGTLELSGSTALYDVIGGELTSTGLLTTNAAAAAQYADEADAVFYVDRQVTLSGAAVTVGSAADLGKAVSMKPVTPPTPSAGTPATTQSVTVKSDAALVLDTTGFVQTLADVETYADSDVDNIVFGKDTTVTVNGKLVLTNVLKTGLIELGSDDSTIGSDVTTDSKFIGVDLTSGLQLVYNSVIGNDTLDARLAARYAQGLSSKEASIIKALEANEAFFGTGVTRSGDETLTAEGLAAYAQAMGGNVTAGVLNVAYDANAQVADAIARHQLAAGNAMGVWADVFHTKNEAKKLYGKTGYEADITGGVLGFDMPVADLFKAGAAVVVGTADTDTVGGLKNSVDTDFWGVSLYAAKDFAGLNVKADLGYLDFSNDFKGTGDASDTASMTFGVRGDFTAYQSGVVTVAPHFGLRFTKIDTDAVAFNKGQDMNVLEAPIGVAVAAAFEAQGWTFRPTADVTIVPQLGDKSVESFGSASEVTVLSGGLVNTTVGVTAEQGAFVFGLNAGYGFGPSDLANTNVNASVVYRF